jgi:mRNA interferase MazF
MVKPGDVVVTMFTYSDLSGAKIRPALVVSRETYNETGSVVITAISSRPVRNQYELLLRDWQEAGLHIPSKVCAGQLMTVKIGLVKIIGCLSQQDFNNARELLNQVLI